GWAIPVLCVADLSLVAALWSAFTRAAAPTDEVHALVGLALVAPGALAALIAGPRFATWLANAASRRSRVAVGLLAHVAAIALLARPAVDGSRRVSVLGRAQVLALESARAGASPADGAGPSL